MHPYRAVRALRSSNGIKHWNRDDDAIGYIAVTVLAQKSLLRRTFAEMKTPRSRGIVALIPVLAVAGLGLAACGGPSMPGAATDLTTTTGTAASSRSNGGTDATSLLAYSSCVRSHGVSNFPDPTGSGGIPKETAQELGVSQTQLETAQSACTHLLPTGGSLSGSNNQTITVKQEQYYLKVAVCMHSHGVTNFPEPSFFASSVEFQGVGHLAGVGSPLFKHAFDICQKLIPVGLPYSIGTSG